MLFQSLPYPDAQRLVAVVPAQKSQPSIAEPISHPTFLDWQDQSRSFESLAAYVVAQSVLTGLGDADAPITVAVTPNIFSLLGATPLVGRTLLRADGDPSAARAIVISEPFWRDRLGARPDVVGAHLTLDGTPYAVVGVMPSTFRFPHSSPAAQLWMPLKQFRPFEQILPARVAPFLSVVGRLRGNYGLQQATAEMQAISARLAQQHHAASRDQIVRVVSLQERVLGDTKSSVLLLLGAVALLLLIACTNVASLQLARTIGRTREMVVRAALGAGRSRLVRQMLIESVLLALAGGAAGVLVAHAIFWTLSAPIAGELSLVRDIRIDRWVLGFTFVLSCATGMFFGLMPVIASSGIDLSGTLRSGGRGATQDRRHTRTQNVLVVLEVALALVLLTSAGLLIRSLVHLQRVDPGFNVSRVLTGTINLPQTEYATQDRWLAFNVELLDRLRQLPGVEDAAFGVGVPFLAPPVPLPFAIEGDATQPDQPKSAEVVVSSPGYFKVMQTPLVRGRAFADSDRRASVRVGIVNRAFARRYLGDRDPVGRAILLGAPKGMRVEIVGVVGDTAHTSLTAEPPPLLHLPYAQRPFWITSFFIRTTGDPQNVASAFRTAVSSMAPSDTGAGAHADERRPAAILCGVQTSDAAARPSQRGGTDSRSGGHVWSACVYRREADQRDRDQAGAGRCAIRCTASRHRPGAAPGACRHGTRTGDLTRRHAVSREPPVPSQRHRSVDCGWRQRAPRPRDARRLLRARAAGDKCRSARHAPLRIVITRDITGVRTLLSALRRQADRRA